MNENKKVLFIINKYSGLAYTPYLESRILSCCDKLGYEPMLEFTAGPGHAFELAQAATASKNFHVIFAVGGDGTVSEVAKGVINTTQVMGVLPKGSGNGLARHLGIPVSMNKIAEYLQSEKVISIDSFSINGRMSINVSGIGFDGHIASLFGKNGKRGLLAYGKLVLKEFYHYPEILVRGEIDDQPFEQPAIILAFANSSQFGNNARVAPLASVTDGLIDICFIRKVPVTQAPGFLLKLFNGRLEKSRLVNYKKGKSIVLNFPQPMPFHIDGEGMEPQTHFEVHINPASIQMLVPDKFYG